MKQKSDVNQVVMLGMLRSKEFKIYITIYMLGFIFLWISLYQLIKGYTFEAFGIWVLGAIFIVLPTLIIPLLIISRIVVIGFKFEQLKKVSKE